MRYMLLIYGDESQIPQTPDGVAPEISAPWLEYTDWLLSRGMHESGERLALSSSATSVRVRDADRLITDGPFAETKEVLGGYYIVECANLDEALEAAGRCPGAMYGTVEVRPILGMPMPSAAGSGKWAG